MHRSLMGMFLFTALAASQLAQAADYCDVRLDDWSGSGIECHQSRASLAAPPTDGGPAGQRVPGLPNYADLDLSPYQAGRFSQLRFELDFEWLGLQPPSDNTRYDYTRIDVLEFGVRSESFMPGEPVDYRVLVVSMVRPFGSNAYTLEFSWRDPAAADAINTTGEVNAAVAQLNGTESKITVQIDPLVDESDWSSLNLRVWARQPGVDPVSNVGLLPGSDDRYVEPVYDNPAGFVMPERPLLSLVRPWNLRSGVIGGDIRRAGMRTDFVFYLPYVDQGE